MTMEWLHYRWAELSAEAVLDRWRERIARVASEESQHVASLPYVRGVAVIGGVGRGDAWPLSDVDMLVAADAPEDTDPEELIAREERLRNARLASQGVPNNVESDWVVLAKDVREAVAESDDGFFSRIAHPHWLGIVIKVAGCQAAHDFDGMIQALLNRCNETFYTDRFTQLWLYNVIAYCGEHLGRAARFIRDGEYMRASVEILRTTYQKLPAGAYAVWREVPQSSGRSVSRFLAAAKRAGDPVTAELYLAASRLDESTTWDRLAVVPAQGRKMRDLTLAIRRGAGEDVDELAATRDMLNLSLWKTVITDLSEVARPRWTGATADPGEVRCQFEAARTFLDWLGRKADRPASASTRRG